jgi:hypothetical protein
VRSPWVEDGDTVPQPLVRVLETKRRGRC